MSGEAGDLETLEDSERQERHPTEDDVPGEPQHQCEQQCQDGHRLRPAGGPEMKFKADKKYLYSDCNISNII